MKLINLLPIVLSLLLLNIATSTAVTKPQCGSIYMKTDGNVHHLEDDELKPGNILYADGHRLVTTDGKTTEVVVGFSHSGYVEGQSPHARFNDITGFLQLGPTHILLVDNNNHCLRLVNRITKMTSPFVGSCQSRGLSDGSFNNSRFSYPRSVIRNQINPEEVIVTDQGNKALRSINLASGEVTTLVKNLPSYPRGASFDHNKENIVISLFNSMGKFNLKTSKFTPFTSSSTVEGWGHDEHNSKDKYNDAKGMICKNSICILADQGFQKLRVLDVSEQVVSSLCTDTNNSAECSLHHPQSMLFRKDSIYIGEKQSIRIVPALEVCPNMAGDNWLNRWTGINSQTGIDACASNPCKNSGKCSAINDKFTCSCMTGWTGAFCEIEVNICSFNPCKNRGTCSPYNNTFTCSCMSGWTGALCETETNACQNNPCLNSGICTPGVNQTYTCACRDGWTGSTCQTEFNACTYNPCLNSGICKVMNNTFTCSCTAGWTGVICEEEIIACKFNPCLNSGQCTATNGMSTCSCTSGWTGNFCEKELDACQNNPCLNNGTCTTGVNNTYTCSCMNGWSGKNCQTELDACQNNPCLNNGICTAGANKTYTCSCKNGWTGKDCETEINVCSYNPCKNRGTCLSYNNTFTCSCMSGWTGALCETELGACLNNPCLNSGICTAGANKTYTCACKNGWTGLNCQTEINVCSFNPCKNRGTCLANNNTFTCSCMSGWTGVLCETELGACRYNPCLNSGICTAGENLAFTCACRAGWTGRTCKTEINVCTYNPCQNSGMCTPTSNGFTCSCKAGFTGAICERDLKNLTCPQDISIVGDSLSMKANVSLWQGDQMTLGVGKYIYYKQLADGTVCTLNVTVKDPRLKWRTDLIADYQLPCSVYNTFRDIILLIAQTRHSQISMITSGNCNKSTAYPIQMSCSNDLVSIIWPTDCVSPKNQESLSLVKGVQGFLKQNAGSILDLFVPTHIPPIIHSSVNQEGHTARLLLSPVCSGGLKYLSTTDACQ